MFDNSCIWDSFFRKPIFHNFYGYKSVKHKFELVKLLSYYCLPLDCVASGFASGRGGVGVGPPPHGSAVLLRPPPAVFARKGYRWCWPLAQWGAGLRGGGGVPRSVARNMYGCLVSDSRDAANGPRRGIV